MSWIERVKLEGRVVRLEPLEERHAPGLLSSADAELFTFTPQAPKEWSLAGFVEDVRRVNAIAGTVAFAVVLNESGAAIGRTTFMETRAEHRNVEIGRTWIGRAYQGTRVNPEMKFLMMRHAFEELNPAAIRVQFTTSYLNEHSQRAIAKLGAVREGVMRKDRVLPDGSVRNSVVFSVIDEEWAAVKKGLVERIGWGAG